jgi:hypothetical protein
MKTRRDGDERVMGNSFWYPAAAHSAHGQVS